MKISKNTIRKIILEQTSHFSDRTYISDNSLGVFDKNYLYDVLYDDVAMIEPNSVSISKEAFAKFEEALGEAVEELKKDFVK